MDVGMFKSMKMCVGVYLAVSASWFLFLGGERAGWDGRWVFSLISYDLFYKISEGNIPS